MRHPRLLSLAATAAVVASLIASVGATAHAAQGSTGHADFSRPATWSVPTAADRGATAVDADSADLEDALMVGINQARAEAGLRKIWSFDVCTDRLAEEWGERIARTGRFEHRDQNQILDRCDNSWAGETLVRGEGLTTEQMVRLWLDSPGHREILLSPRARRAGVAITQDAQGRTIGVVNLVRHG